MTGIGGISMTMKRKMARASVASRVTIHLQRRCLSAGTVTASSVRLPVVAITGTTVPTVSTRGMSMIASQETG